MGFHERQENYYTRNLEQSKKGYLSLGKSEEEQEESLDLPIEWEPVRLCDVSVGGSRSNDFGR